MCRPELKGFFYSSFLELCFHKIFQWLLNKGDKPLWLGTVDSPFGSSALIILPQSTAEMKKKSLPEREQKLLKGLNLAQKLGAKKLAFAGLLPSLLNHFQDLTNKELVSYKESLIKDQTMTLFGGGDSFSQTFKNNKLSDIVSCRIRSYRNQLSPSFFGKAKKTKKNYPL